MAIVHYSRPPVVEQVPQRVRAVAAVAAGSILVLHGIVHSIGFFAQWHISRFVGTGPMTAALDGRLSMGGASTRVVGLLWLVAAAAFVALGIRLAWTKHVEKNLVAATAVFSLVLCVLGLPSAVAGIWIDSAILLVLTVVLTLRVPPHPELPAR